MTELVPVEGPAQHWRLAAACPGALPVAARAQSTHDSGQLGTLTLAQGGSEGGTRHLLENLLALLARRGRGLAHVVKCTVFLADLAEWPAFNAVYREQFRAPLPARRALGPDGRVLDARAEASASPGGPRQRDCRPARLRGLASEVNRITARRLPPPDRPRTLRRIPPRRR